MTSGLHRLARAATAATVVTFGAAAARDAPPTAFSTQVTAATGDWVAEDWRRGRITMHPARYTWQSDVFLAVAPPEPPAGRTPMQVLLGYFDTVTVTTDNIKVDMHGASELAPGILLQKFRWNYAFKDYLGFWGVVTTKAGAYIAFNAQCELAHPKDYPGDLCLKKVVTLLVGLREEQVRLPGQPAPLNVPGWEGSYGTDGVSVVTNRSYNGLRVASVRASMPMTIEPARLPEAIKEFSDGAIDDNDQARKNGGSATWSGSTADPWLRRTFPDAFDGPSIIMAGATHVPDGRTVLLSVRCPNRGWQATCAYGIEQAKFHVGTGLVEQRRLAVVAATNTPLPEGGITTDQILGIYAAGRFDGTSFVMHGHLYLKDGTVYDGFGVMPAFVNAAGSKRDSPEKWGRWTRTGDGITITWNSGMTETVPAAPDSLLVGGTADTRMDGYYETVSSGGSLITGSGWVSRQGYRFYPDGTFTRSTGSSFAVGSFLPGEAGPTTIASGGSNSRTARARYAVDGYMITLTYPDGRIERRAFATYAKDGNDPRRTTVLIGETPFTRDK